MRGLIAKLLIVMLGVTGLFANEAGENYLLSEANVSASAYTQGRYSTAFQSVAQTLQSAEKIALPLDSGFMSEAVAFVCSDEHNTTEWLSRKIMAGCDPVGNLALLLGAQNRDGGFGELPGYHGTLIDTAFALEALLYANAPSSAVDAAVSYLSGAQRPEGSWSEGVNESSVYLTAVVMHALWLNRHKYDLNNRLLSAKSFLESRKLNSLWGEAHQSAKVLIAISPMYDDNTALQSSVEALYAIQQPDGSWESDPYTTALILQAIAAASSAVPNPDLGSIGGVVVDGDTGIAMSGVTVNLLNAETNLTVQSGLNGSFVFRALKSGSYTVSMTAEGYTAVQSALSLLSGESKELGRISLIAQGASQQVVFSGTINDAADGTALSGVEVTYANSTVLTDATGSYILRSDVTGTQTLQAFKAGYISQNLSMNFKAGSSYSFSPALKRSNVVVIPNNPYSLLFGVIKDANSSEPIEGAQILLTGNTNFVVRTDVNGSYLYEPLNAGALNLTIVKSGYKPLALNLNVNDGDAIEFSPYMEPRTAPEIKNIKGVVFDSIENVPLPGVNVRVDSNETNYKTVMTDSEGLFELNNIEADHVTVSYSKDTYKSLSYGMSLAADYATGSTAIFDVGQVRLRPISADIILPDLVAVDMNISALQSDPMTLRTTGTIGFKVKNVGTAPAMQSFKAIAFFDANNNGVFDDANDTMMGSSDLNLSIQIGEAKSATITVAGKVPFADAYLTVLIDSGRNILEIDELNNVILTTEAYNTIKSDVRDSKPVVKWQWRGDSNASTNNISIFSKHIVVPLEDTNSDGLINEKDTSSIVFTTTYANKNGIDGTLIALSGVDGHELWRIPYGAHALNNCLMAGDIDNDGLVEILVHRYNYMNFNYDHTSLVVYEHDGTIKWEANLHPKGTYWFRSYSSGVISDLDGDGDTEILFAGFVFDHNGNKLWSYHNPPFSFDSTVAVDLNLDGYKEIVTGKEIFDYQGNILHTIENPYVPYATAIANMNDDPYPEIITTGSYGLTLYDHTGKKIWGPINYSSNKPYDSFWMQPTVLNVDQDSYPEILLEFKIVKADGSILWSNIANDQYYKNHELELADYKRIARSNVGFDFNSDGYAEVFSYSTEEMSIVDGQSGKELIGMPSSGMSLYRVPTVVDMDHDGSSEIVNTETSARGTYGGVTVWEDAEGGWAGTRSIWNQDRYFINNVNEDGTIPKEEGAYWLEHNTFRVNPSYSFQKADATLSLLALYDNGINQPYSLSARVGNGGNVPITKALIVSFYDGNPDEGGILLGTVDAGSVPPNGYRDVMLEGVTQLVNQQIYAVVDASGAISEYDENNNRIAIAVVSTQVPATLAAATDRTIYGVNEEANLTALVTNPGRLSYALAAQLQVTDAAGGVVETFAPVDLGLLASGGSRTVSQLWNSGTLLSGAYLLKATLYDSEGNIVNESSVSFTIVSDSGTAEQASLRLDPVGSIFHTSDTLFVDSLVGNLSLNAILRNATLELEARHADTNATLFSRAVTLAEMAPEALRTVPNTFTFVSAPEGIYRLDGVIRSESGEVLATHRIEVEIKEELSKTLFGSVTAESAVLEQGTLQRCSDTLYYAGSQSSVSIRQLLVETTTSAILQSGELSLAADTNQTLQREIATDTLEPGSYACLLQAFDGTAWVSLGYAPFSVEVKADQCDASSVYNWASDPYNLLLFNSFNASNSDVECAIAVGGNMTLDNYSIGALETRGIASLIGGVATLSNGTAHGDLNIIGDDATILSNWDISFNVTGTLAFVDANASGVDFAAAREAYLQSSRAIAELNTTGVVASDPYWDGAFILRGDDNASLQVFALEDTALEGKVEIRLEQIPQEATVVVNVGGTDVTLPLQSYNQVAQRDMGRRFMFNFPDALNLNIIGSGYGTILAPKATLHTTWGVHNGQIIADAFEGPLQVNCVISDINLSLPGCITQQPDAPVAEANTTAEINTTDPVATCTQTPITYTLAEQPYTLLVYGDMNLSDTSMPGSTAVQGDLSASGCAFGTLGSAAPALVIGGIPTLSNGSANGDVVLLGAEQSIIDNWPQSFGVSGAITLADAASAPLDFNAGALWMQALSDALVSLPVTGQAMNDPYWSGALVLTGDGVSMQQHFVVAADALSQKVELRLDAIPEGANVVLSITGASVGVPMSSYGQIAAREQGSRFMMHFPDAERVELGGGSYGTILAPHAEVVTGWSEHSGSVIARAYSGHGRITPIRSAIEITIDPCDTNATN